MDQEDNVLLAKWLDGNINPEELQQLEQEYDLPKLKKVLDQQKAFDLQLEPVAEMWDSLQTTLKAIPKEKPKRNFKWLWILLLLSLVALGLLYFLQNDNQKIETLPGETTIKVFAQGSKVHLSPSSSISFKEENWKEERRIQLRGQAFFDVEKGSPFIVETPQAKVEVLGTQFDIWEMGGLMRIQCFEGSVRVSKAGQIQVLQANQELQVNKNKLSSVQSFDGKSPDWVREERVFEKTLMSVVLKDLERFYNIEFDTKSVRTTEEFSGIFPTNDLEKALNYLTRSTNWQYEIKNNIVYLRPN